MKISVNWLKDYIDFNISSEELFDKMTSIGFDIESVEYQRDLLKHFVIGRVIEISKHPNAEKLTLCKVDTGTKVLHIVCGAPNVDAGQTVCVALPGAIIPSGGFEIKKSKLRGEVSEGMICSESELNLGEDKGGIMVLENDKEPVGGQFSDYLGMDDVIIEISVTPNRGDLLSHIGVAREVVASLQNTQLTIKEFNDNFHYGDEINKFIKVEIENPEGCYRYCGRLIKDIKVKESPEWLKKRLTSVGIRPINNIVDVTNFVMLECGQPLHAFDYDFIEGNKIIIRNAGRTKKFITLDGKERGLRSDILLICDDKNPVALAGIMGGENSEIKNETKNVFIESAFFDPVLTRKSSKFLGLQTDSSYRFERGVDIEKVTWACNRAAELISELAEGQIIDGMIDVYPLKLTKRIIELRTEYLNKIIGSEFNKSEVKKKLDLIGIKCMDENNNRLVFEIPFHRYYDITQEIDLIEEFAKINGYDLIIPSEFDNLSYNITSLDYTSFGTKNFLREYFIGRGFKEIITNSLLDSKILKHFDEDYLEVANPSSVEMNCYRNNLFLGALDTVALNFNHKSTTLKLFEIGDVATTDANGYFPAINEKTILNLTLAGEYDLKALNQKQRDFDVYDMKGEVEMLLAKLNIDYYNINDYNYSEKFDFYIDYIVRDKVICKIFQIDNKKSEFFNINPDVIFCEIYIKELSAYINQSRRFKEISKYPYILRDLSIIVDKSVKSKSIENIIEKSGGKLLKKLRLYDIYDIKQDEKFKSMTYSLEFASDERTLTDEEVNQLQDKIINKLKKELNAELRN